mmetsp:Transcript_15006/g.20577  ORF Transcript_15006/g.20577 Transcript_15006/m.20577 type:complete len:212 (+) Transcript_15006:846-1481(+)
MFFLRVSSDAVLKSSSFFPQPLNICFTAVVVVEFVVMIVESDALLTVELFAVLFVVEVVLDVLVVVLAVLAMALKLLMNEVTDVAILAELIAKELLLLVLVVVLTVLSAAGGRSVLSTACRSGKLTSTKATPIEKELSTRCRYRAASRNPPSKMLMCKKDLFKKYMATAFSLASCSSMSWLSSLLASCSLRLPVNTPPALASKLLGLLDCF